MLGLGTIGKLVKGGLGPDEIGEIFAAAGIEFEFQSLQADQVPMEFQRVAEKTQETGAKVLSLRGRMKDGQVEDCLVVFSQIPCTAATERRIAAKTISAKTVTEGA